MGANNNIDSTFAQALRYFLALFGGIKARHARDFDGKAGITFGESLVVLLDQ